MKTFEEVSKDDKTFVIIFGNKTDLPRDRGEFERVRKEVGRHYPKLDQLLCIEGSAKDGLNIHQIFEEILQNFEESSNSSRKIDSSKSVGETLIKSFNKNGLTPKTNPCCNM
jgi:predicted GTPase